MVSRITKDLVASAILCVQDSSFPELRAACLHMLQAHYGQGKYKLLHLYLFYDVFIFIYFYICITRFCFLENFFLKLILLSILCADDEHRKEFSVNFMSVLVATFDASIKDLVPQVGAALCELLAALTSGTGLSPLHILPLSYSFPLLLPFTHSICISLSLTRSLAPLLPLSSLCR